MKHKTTNLMTKRALAESLKKLMEQKSLDKISVREIIEDCGVNRKTFYYHFHDIYDLVQWIFEEEAIEVVRSYDLLVDYEDAVRFVLDYVERNKHLCNCVVSTLGREQLKLFLQKDFDAIIGKCIEDMSEGLVVPQAYKEFLMNFYKEATASMLIEWIQFKEEIDIQELIEYVSFTLYETMQHALIRASEKFEHKK